MNYDRYLTYAELTAQLERLVAEHQDLARLESAGKSFEGRDIWALTLSAGTRPAHEKPAMYIEGNIHAGEVAASMVCLYAAEHLLQNYGRCDDITHLLDTRAYYILPRVNPDGAEKYLTTPFTLRSSVKPYPDVEVADLPGLHPSDVNDDGHILLMRVRDDKRGEWAVSRKDPRVMIRRTPGARGGPFYRVYPEGMIHQFEGEPFDVIRSPWGLDLNRNFPSNWDRSFVSGGAFPTSEPEVKAVVEFIVGHRNIGCLQSFHTSGGFFFRNPYQYGDDKMDAEDLRAMREIAAQGKHLTGYPDVKSSNRSTLPEWAYEHLGLIGYTSELWDRLGRAGINSVEAMKITDPQKVEEMQVALLSWNDRELCGEGFIAWHAFQHPQLGSVEIGGWEPKFVIHNPPHHLLYQECHKNALWAISHSASLPELEIGEVKSHRLGCQTYRIDVRVHNNGYLPTNITNKGKEVAGLRPDYVRVSGGGVSVISGNAEVSVGFLQGYLNAAVSNMHVAPIHAKSTATASFTIVTAADSILVELCSHRAGIVRRRVDLK